MLLILQNTNTNQLKRPSFYISFNFIQCLNVIIVILKVKGCGAIIVILKVSIHHTKQGLSLLYQWSKHLQSICSINIRINKELKSFDRG